MTVSYIPPASNPVQDVGGTPAAALTDRAVTNNTAARAPELGSAAVEGRTLSLTYDESLDTGATPSAASFSVAVVRDGTRTVRAVAVTADTVRLTLDRAVQAGLAVTVSYTPPASSPVRDLGGTPAAALTDETVANNTPARAPGLRSAVVDTVTLTLTYDESLDTGARPPGSSFSVAVEGDGTRTVTTVASDTTTVTLTLDRAVQAGQSVTVSYIPPASNPVQDVGGTPAAALTDRAVTNNTAARAPELGSAAVEGRTLSLTYDESLDTGATPSAASFSVAVVRDGTRTVRAVAVTADTVRLTLDRAVQAGLAVTVSYTPPASSPVRDLGGTPAAALTDETVANNTPARAPGLRSAVVDTVTLTLTYDESLDTGAAPNADSFSVAVARDGTRTVTTVASDTTTVTLTLDRAVQAGQSVTVSYTPPATNPVRDVGGTPAAALTDEAVVNTTPARQNPSLTVPGGGGGGGGGGGAGGPAPEQEPTSDDTPGIKIRGTEFTAATVATTFTVGGIDDGAEHSLQWRASGPGGFAAAGTSEQFAFTPPTGGDYTVGVTVVARDGDADKTITDSLVVTVFADIADTFTADIIWLAQQGITVGCDSHRYCPDEPVTRGQMAAFLHRALDLPAAQHDPFDDDNDSHFQDAINRLAQSGITVGCGTRRYCPDEPVTRGQMAAFLHRALDLPAAQHDPFDDDNDSRFQDAINRLAQQGITTGCGTRRYCPDEPVTRGQMAAFLHRAEDLITAARSRTA